MQALTGIWVPLVTPFAADGQVDHPALAALVATLAQAGVHGFVACGSTGEAAMLDPDEQDAVLRTVLHAAEAAGQRPVLMGASGCSARDVTAQVRRHAALPLAGFLVPPPLYVRPSQAGIVEFYREVAEAAAPQGLVVYDIPYRTGAEMTLDTLRRIAGLPGVLGLKDCGGDARKTQALIADGRLAVLAGEDHQIFTTLCQGGQGAIAATAHLHPQHFVAMFESVRAGNLLHARRLHHALAPLVASLFAEPNPAPLKAQLAAQGLIRPGVRAPLMAASDASACAVREAWQRSA